MKVSQEQAELLAASALSFIAQDTDRMARFLSMTGIGPMDIRERIKDPVFLGGVLDFLLNYEPDLMEFIDFAGVEPEFPMMARRALPGAEDLD